MAHSPTQSLLLIDASGACRLAESLSSGFIVHGLNVLAVPAELSAQDFAVLLLDARGLSQAEYFALCRALKTQPGWEDLPLFLYVGENEKLDMMQVYEAGVDDVVNAATDTSELLARLNKAVFHTIAQRQLKSRLKQANEMAFTAMADTSDLGVNIQFLVHCHECSNVDELGMLLFRTLGHYQLNCSLQIRSAFEVKNLEETGLAKDLEARLLWELKDSGRYVDFGRRCVMNYGKVSLLVKKMPDDPRRFGAIKDNVFSLLQGADARVTAVDNARLLEMERDVMRGMAQNMQKVMAQVDNRYQEVMARCATLVEDIAMRVEQSILFLDLTEAQEETFTEIMQTGVHAVNRLFAEGIRIDESFRRLIDHLNTTVLSGDHASVDELRRVLDRL